MRLELANFIPPSTFQAAETEAIEFWGPSSVQLVLLYRAWLKHYLPYWSVILLLPIPWLASLIDVPQTASTQPTALTVSGTRELNFAADVTLALITFWMWAFITSAYSGCSIRSAGEKKYSAKDGGGEKARKSEFASLAFFAMITVLVYFAAVIPALHGSSVKALALVTIIFPVLVLGSPP